MISLSGIIIVTKTLTSSVNELALLLFFWFIGVIIFGSIMYYIGEKTSNYSSNYIIQFSFAMYSTKLVFKPPSSLDLDLEDRRLRITNYKCDPIPSITLFFNPLIELQVEWPMTLQSTVSIVRVRLVQYYTVLGGLSLRWVQLVTATCTLNLPGVNSLNFSSTLNNTLQFTGLLHCGLGKILPRYTFDADDEWSVGSLQSWNLKPVSESFTWTVFQTQSDSTVLSSSLPTGSLQHTIFSMLCLCFGQQLIIVYHLQALVAAPLFLLLFS